MNPRIPTAALALGLAFGTFHPAAAAPPEGAAPAMMLEGAPQGTVVFDDDGGRVQIVPRHGLAAREPVYHGGPAVSAGRIQSLFLGSAWRDAANRGLETQMVEGLASRAGSSTLPSLASYGLAAPELLRPALADPIALPRRQTLADLQIQKRLNRLVTAASARPLEPGVVFVVFLPPGVRSTVGDSRSDKDFVAYHNHLHTAAGVVRYTVVPYDEEFARWLANAHQGLVEMLINPEGTGWY